MPSGVVGRDGFGRIERHADGDRRAGRRRGRAARPRSALVTLVSDPGVDDVSVTTIVQPPGGMALPAAIVISVGVTVTPAHVPVLPLVVVMPAGIGSVNGAVRTSGAALGLVIVIVSVAVPPSGIARGRDGLRRGRRWRRR